MPDLLECQPSVAFAETASDFPDCSDTASVFAEESSESDPSVVIAPDPFPEHWFVALKLEARRLKLDVIRVAPEIPRFLQFSTAFQKFLGATYKQRTENRNRIVESIRASSVPSIYIHEILRQCSTGGGPDGLDIAIDLLAGFGDTLLAVFDSFLQRDRTRWPHATLAKHVNDDVCYILLRALACSTVPQKEKLPPIKECALTGTRSIREAATHALGDLGGEAARQLLQGMANDPDALVRQSAQEALGDLDA